MLELACTLIFYTVPQDLLGNSRHKKGSRLLQVEATEQPKSSPKLEADMYFGNLEGALAILCFDEFLVYENKTDLL